MYEHRRYNLVRDQHPTNKIQNFTPIETIPNDLILKCRTPLREKMNSILPLLHDHFRLLFHIDTMKINVELIVDHRLHLEDREEEKLNQIERVMLEVIEYFE